MKALLPSARSATGLAAAVGVLLAAAPPAGAATVFGVTKASELAKFDSRQPNDVKVKSLGGLPNGVKLVGVDQRPSNGKLYGIGDDSVVYKISKDAKAQAVGDGFGNLQLNPPSPGAPLDGDSFGVDFNPVPDAIRIVSNTGQNLRVSPSSGDLIAEDGELNGADAKIVDAAYTNSQRAATPPVAATLYVLDAKDDTIYTQSPPNDGTLTNPVPIDIDITKTSSLDLIGGGTKGLIAEDRGRNSVLYRVKEPTGGPGLSGDTKKIGRIRAGSPLVGLAVDQPQAG